MKRRLIAAVAAITLAIVGAVLILNYVSSADERAAAGMQTTTVLVVATPIPEGTPGEDLAPFLVVKDVPANAVADGAVADLEQISGQVSTVDLQPGEQVLSSRFVDPESVRAPTTVTIPPGMEQVTVLLEPHRVLGGNLNAGAVVAIFVTMGEPSETSLALDQVLVSKVQGGIAPAPSQSANETTDPAEAPAEPPAADNPPVPSGSIMVTFVLSPADAQKLIYSAEHGTLWLSLKSADGQ